MSGSPDRLMHLFGFNLFCPAQHSNTAWRYPLNTPPGQEWNQPEVWQRMAQDLERGKFDGIFFADHLAAQATYNGSSDATLENGMMFPVQDPLLLTPMLAAVTDRLGIATTLSTTYYHPYMAVRKLSTLDHLTRGRAGWNIVTSFHEGESRNFGMEPIPHDQRYERANEYMEVCHKLWNSWEPGAVVRDVEKPMLIDPSKVTPIEHDGEYYKCSGFAVTEPSPQKHPVLFQAGSSPAGRDFCAQWAEASFAVMVDAQQMKEFVADMGERADKFDRPPPPCFFGIQPIIGLSEAEAHEKRDEIHELITVDGAMAAISGHTGFDFGTLNPDDPLSEVPELPGIQGMFASLVDFAGKSGDEEMTIGEAIRFYGDSNMLTQVVGTAEQVAEQMTEMWRDSGAGGFLCTPLYYPGAYTEFVDLVVPILQRYKVFRHDYQGRTLREHLGQTELE
jgi:FMN-dependent oxidoreductase (nitrilotriacetate monooxygenase family)